MMMWKIKVYVFAGHKEHVEVNEAKEQGFRCVNKDATAFDPHTSLLVRQHH